MNYPFWLIAIFVFAIGSVIGSFMNVCIYRLPKGLSLVKPRSFCPECKRMIPWYRNIPVISYAALAGRCAECGTWISPMYPFVEALNALLYLFLYLTFGFSLEFLFYALFVSMLVILFFIDYREKMLPDRITLPGIIFGIGVSPLIEELGIVSSILGAATGFSFFYVVAFLYEKWTGREGMGGGDIKMIAMVGAFLGLQGVIATILIASLLGAFFGLSLVTFCRKDLTYAVPFGCFISAGALIVLFFGGYLFTLYARLIGVYG